MVYFEENKISSLLLSSDYEFYKEGLWNRYSVFSLLNNIPFLDFISFKNLLKLPQIKFFKAFDSYIIGMEEDSFFIALFYITSSLETLVQLIRHVNQYDDIVFVVETKNYFLAKRYLDLGYKVRFKDYVSISKNRKINKTLSSIPLQKILPTLSLPYKNITQEIKDLLK